MGAYNPSQPYILGNEWVPIKQNDITFSQDANSVEYGAKFTTAQNYKLQEGRFYIGQFPPNFYRYQIMNVNVYPYGQEAWSGPIERVVLPCNTCTTANVTILDGRSAVQSVYDPSSDGGLVFDYGGGSGTTRTATFNFDTTAVTNALPGKRILGVNFLYNLTVSSPERLIPNGISNLFLYVENNVAASANIFRYPDLWLGPQYAGDSDISRIKLGDTTLFPNNDLYALDSWPWQAFDLLNFSNGATNPIKLIIKLPTVDGLGPQVVVAYAALEIIYCAENRVASGSHIYNNRSWDQVASPFGGMELSYVYNTNIVALRTISRTTAANTTFPFLAAGDYTLTLAQANWGDIVTFGSSGRPEPTVNAARQLYALPTHPAIQLNIPTPTDPGIVGKVMTKVTSAILPQLSLHATGGVLLTEPHVYGRQAAGNVGDNGAGPAAFDFVTQKVNDNMGVSRTYNQLRFWARRFGDTTYPLIVGNGTSLGSITPAAFDLLPEVLDGWKQVDLTMTPGVTMGTATYPTFTWSQSPTEDKDGARWQILGAYAPALTGSVSLPYQRSGVLLGPATYGGPISGGAILMNWSPYWEPPNQNPQPDQSADVSFLFSVDPPTVTGFALSGTSQALTGIGQLCGINPAFIPSAMSYNRVTWSPVWSLQGLPVSGFGYYELQRSDTLTDWQTIMKATSPTVSGFNDFEARVGVTTSYRIRTANSYLFLGAWSSTISGSLSAPGITGTGMGADDHVMIFSSNFYQNGSKNLAYSMAWETHQPTEAFTFPEANFTQYQAMYNRDFYVAFRPTERGGDQFQRTILVQAAAIPAETLADFTSLRDMAWTSMPYVCIRDEDGNRWFANVTVPTGRVMRDRKLYLADIGVVETTSTAATITVTS